MRSSLSSSSSSASSPSFNLKPSPTLSLSPLSHLPHSTHRSTLSHLLSLSSLPPSLSSTHYSLSLFHQINRPNTFASNSLIRCLAKSPNPSHSLHFYAHMRRIGIPTNNFTYPFVLQACSKGSLMPEGVQIHTHVLKFGFDRDLYVRNGLIGFYCACSDLGSSRRVFDGYPFVRDVVSWNVMIVGYARAGEICVAEKVFDDMPERDVVSWSSMIVGYVSNGMLEKSLKLFRQMIDKRLAVNEAALVTVLSASAQLGLLDYGSFVHESIKKLKFPLTINIGAALVDMYAKCGCVELSRQVFDDLPKKDVFAWNAMLCGLATHGLGKEALDLFERFTEEGFHPTNVTFVGVLNACSRAGLVNEGRQHFNSMIRDYGIEPEMEHYGCIVDLLGRAGLVNEAVKLIENMSIKPDPVLWGTLLGACKMHGLVELGVSIGSKLLELEPAHDGHYVLLAGIYAKAKKWDDVLKIRKLMANRGTNKSAGWSLIEAHGNVHKFVAGDKDHERSLEIYKKLEMIGLRLENAGYLPGISSVLHDIGDEDKIHVIKEHSERLAIAFGLMVIQVGYPIRIVKNLRVCVDCHEFSKMVAKVFDREIIVRDGSRFHHFKDGRCSCLDYW
ncbi:pentatricopeptide repeat-containing protein At3g62890-like [Asparagus officinalis]|uniref:pentatricopeptide repeat-containing protein At3g62890-like n=1 Tax=Asparagus officinalis TaxID=4686 RepID=UPI00098DE733|nr:pentatricopeptide repeat-containing protein At3g62890-like [Asparagus officinalis]